MDNKHQYREYCITHCLLLRTEEDLEELIPQRFALDPLT
jgi:hypothetical protein